MEHVTDAQNGRQSDGAAGFDLLPVAGGKAEGKHVLLAEAVFFPHELQSHPQIPECRFKFVLTLHASSCNVTRAETPRAD